MPSSHVTPSDRIESSLSTSATVDADGYEALVTKSPQGSIYCRRWWLDAVAPGSYRIFEKHAGNELVAAWPLAFKPNGDGSAVEMPPLSQKLGILFSTSNAKYAEELSNQHEIIESFIAMIPQVTSFAQRFHEQFTNWLPFYWNGFHQTTRYTYILPDISDLDRVWNNMRSGARRCIRKAVKSELRVVDDFDVHEFIRLHDMVFERQGIEVAITPDVIRRLDDACSKRDCRKIFAAIDANGRPHAAAFIAWDNGTAYYLMGGSDPQLRESNAMRLVQWEAIKFAATIAHQFDFEGSMIKGVESSVRSFGARQVPYFSITKFDRGRGLSRLNPRRVTAGVMRRIANLIDPT